MENENKKVILTKFGNNLREIRVAKGFTQEKLANELGVEISQISRIERGIINTSIVSIYQLSKILKINIADLFNINGNKLNLIFFSYQELIKFSIFLKNKN